jgi:hypothetical protein
MTYQPSLAHRDDFQNGRVARGRFGRFSGRVNALAGRVLKSVLSAQAEAATVRIEKFFYRGSVRAVDTWKANGLD